MFLGRRAIGREDEFNRASETDRPRPLANLVEFGRRRSLTDAIRYAFGQIRVAVPAGSRESQNMGKQLKPVGPNRPDHASSRSEKAIETVELWTRIARRQLCRISIADDAKEIRLNRRRICKEGRIDGIIVECRHRPDIKAERPQSEDQIAPLQGCIAKGGNASRIRVSKPRLCIHARK